MQSAIGSVISLWRYPVKSMLGEELETTQVTDRGLTGDRAYAIVDRSDGKVASAKNPRKWSSLFDCHSTVLDSKGTDGEAPRVRIALPDGTSLSSDQDDCNVILSKALNRDVTLESAATGSLDLEEYWPDIEGLPHRDTVTEFRLPDGTFFDGATVHLLTTATLDHLGELYPEGRFEVARFRPNVVVQLASDERSFAEDAWVGHTVAIGSDVRLQITRKCGRCVMTTLAQGDLPKDPGILRTVAQHNKVNVGVYAAVLRGGTVSRGDSVLVD
jgi:uncharacterized protein YcbX